MNSFRVVFAAALVGSISGLPAESIQHRVTFDPSGIVLTKEGEFDVIHMEGTFPAGEEGSPRLPVKTVFLALPQGTSPQGVKVTRLESDLLDGEYLPLPIQRPGIPGELVEFTQPRRELYSSSETYPSAVVRLGVSGHMSGYPVAAILVYPIQYLPSEKAFLFHRTVEFEIELSPSSGQVFYPRRGTRPGENKMERLLNALVTNPEGVERARPAHRGESLEAAPGEHAGFAPSGTPSVHGSPVDYLIITSEELKPAFEALAEWKTRKGVPAAVRSLEDIKTHTQAGADDAETLRRFIAEAHEKWGIIWVLLGGDVSVVPVRYVDVNNSQKTTVSDLYYGDLDGNWNADGDDRWGERSGDDVDFFFDVFVGRAPVETVQEAEDFVTKAIGYDQGMGSHQNRLLYLGEKLWPGDGKTYCERVDGHVNGSGFEKTKLFESDGTENRERALTAMNSGNNLIFNVGHGNAYVINVGPAGHLLEHSDMYALQNRGRYSIFYNVTCNSNDISYDDSFSELFMLNPEGGGVGYIGSTWLDYPSVSILQNEEFFKLIFQEGDWKLGSAFGRSMLPLAPFKSGQVYRQVYLNYLLLGDPELSMHTGVPAPLVVEAPSSLMIGSSDLSVAVYDTTYGDREPAAGVTVCAIKGDEVYVVGVTGSSGTVTLPVAPLTPGDLTVTASGHNFSAFLGTVEVQGSPRPFAYCGGYTVIDTLDGNGDGILNPGETARLGTSITNGGGWVLPAGESSPISVKLSSLSHEVKVLSGTRSVHRPIRPSDSAWVYFDVTVPEYVPDETVVPLKVTVSNREGAWEDTVRLTLRSPEIRHVLSRYDKGEGEWECWLTVVNEGSGAARDVTGNLTIMSGRGMIRDDSHDYGELGPGETKSGVFSFRPYEDPSGMILGLVLTDRYGHTWKHSFDLVPPDSPRDLEFSLEGENIRLSWAPGDEPDLAGYFVFRSDAPEGPYISLLGSPLSRIAYYEDAGLEAGKRLWYRVSSLDSSGNESVWSDSLAAWTENVLVQGWPVTVNTLVRSGPTMVDVGGDGSVDMFMAALNGTIYSSTDPSGGEAPAGPYVRPGGSIWSKPAIDDMDRDGVLEMVVTLYGGTQGGPIQAWKIQDADGDEVVDPLAGWPPGVVSEAGFISSPVLADVDGDRFLEVVAMDLTGQVYVWDHDGSLKAGWPKVAGGGSGRGHLYATVAVGNLDGDPEFEIVAFGGNRSQNLGSIYVWGQTYLDTALIFEGPGPFSASPVLADLDSDGDLEIVALSERNLLYVLEKDGTFMEGWEGGKAVKVINVWNQNSITPSPAVADLDNDGQLEIVVSSTEGIVVWHADGSLLDGFPLTGIELPRSPVLADVDGDPEIEIVVGAGDRKLYAFNPDGSAVPGWPVTVGGPIVSASGVGDMDGDGFNDIVWASEDFEIYRMETQGDPSRVPWGTFLHDMANTGMYHYRYVPLAVEEAPTNQAGLPVRFDLYQNFPNPFNSVTIIRYALAEDAYLSLKVFDLRGREIRSLADGRDTRGIATVTWDGRDDAGHPVGSGVYLVHLRAGSHLQTRKIVLVK